MTLKFRLLGFLVLGLVSLSVLACAGPTPSPTPPPKPISTPTPRVTPTPNPEAVFKQAVAKWVQGGVSGLAKEIAARVTGDIPVAKDVIAQAIESSISSKAGWSVAAVRELGDGRVTGLVHFGLPLKFDLPIFKGDYTLRFSYAVVADQQEVKEARLDLGSVSIVGSGQRIQEPATPTPTPRLATPTVTPGLPPQAGPLPRTTNVGYPAKVKVSDTIVITVEATIGGTDSPEGDLHVAFPGNPSRTSILGVSTDANRGSIKGFPGQEQFGNYGSGDRFVLRYPIVSAVQAPWKGGLQVTRKLTVQVKAESPGQFVFEVKFTVDPGTGGRWRGDPSPNCDTCPLDQQNERVNRFTVEVQQ